MITLISAIVGFLSSALPDIIKLFQDKNTNKNQSNLLQMQIEAMKENNNALSEQLQTVAAMKENLAVHKNYDSTTTTSKFINALRASVRPIVTYLFFCLFATVKIMCLIKFLNAGDSLASSMILIWDKSTQYLFTAIIAFWFGTRQMEKIRNT